MISKLAISSRYSNLARRFQPRLWITEVSHFRAFCLRYLKRLSIASCVNSFIPRQFYQKISTDFGEAIPAQTFFYRSSMIGSWHATGRLAHQLFSYIFQKHLTMYQQLPILLKQYGVGGTVLAWTRNFLCGRSQKIVLPSQSSQPFECNKGVPQGSVLEPLLSNVYVSDLPEVSRKSTDASLTIFRWWFHVILLSQNSWGSRWGCFYCSEGFINLTGCKRTEPFNWEDGVNVHHTEANCCRS